MTSNQPPDTSHPGSPASGDGQTSHPHRPFGHNQQDALIALATIHSQPLDARYRLANHLDALLDPSLTAEAVAAAAEVRPESVDLGRRAIADQSAIAQTRESTREQGAWIVTKVDTGYPKRLHELELPPPCLFCRSKRDPNDSRSLLNAPAVGIVGPRNADPYGIEAARLFATDLAAAGLVITSGFARGVDGVSHEAAALSGNPTVAVLGCGVDIAYPRQNQHLIEPILANEGMLISEFPLGTAPAPWRFPVRNRLIAAQTMSMIVVQATLRSGSLISARLALDCGRDVFAVPGRIFDQRSKGTNRLLADGAHVALDAKSVLEALPLCVQDQLLRSKLGNDGALRHRAVLSHLQENPCTAEQLAQTLGLKIGTVLQDLTEMELSGHVERLIGGLFAANPASEGSDPCA